MRPKIFKVDPFSIDTDILRQAAAILNNRGLVAFPTETVYGLGADATDPKAVASIFEAKKRPLDDPLIVHISRREDVDSLAEDIPDEARKLMDSFWPGPLTLVLKKKNVIPDIVTTGLDTVAVRMPSGAIAAGFIEACGVPVAAPSANIFGRPSPTTAEHVLHDLEGRIDAVLDGGSTEIGIESTVIGFRGHRANVLRPGGIDIESLNTLLGGVDIAPEEGDSSTSPGRYPRHYSPEASVTLVAEGPGQVERTRESVNELRSKGLRAGIMSLQEHFDGYGDMDDVKVLGPGDDLRICASRLFHVLREFDAEGVDAIVAEGVREEGLGRAIMNRLRKASYRGE